MSSRQRELVLSGWLSSQHGIYVSLVPWPSAYENRRRKCYKESCPRPIWPSEGWVPPAFPCELRELRTPRRELVALQAWWLARPAVSHLSSLRRCVSGDLSVEQSGRNGVALGPLDPACRSLCSLAKPVVESPVSPTFPPHACGPLCVLLMACTSRGGSTHKQHWSRQMPVMGI